MVCTSHRAEDKSRVLVGEFLAQQACGCALWCVGAGCGARPQGAEFPHSNFNPVIGPFESTVYTSFAR